jgi:hypothetical protein
MSPKPFEDVIWHSIFMPRPYGYPVREQKFTKAISPLPLINSFEDNVHRTVEWLLRNGRTIEVQHQDALLCNKIKDFWYESNRHNSRLLHVCFPQDLLKFRHKYGILYDEYRQLPFTKMSTKVLDLQENICRTFWAQWNCMGSDERFDPFKAPESSPLIERKPSKTLNACNTCHTPIPKGVQIWLKLEKVHNLVGSI